MTLEKYARTQREMIVNAKRMRGEVLQRATEIESMLDIYIGEHFTNDPVLVEELLCLIIAPRVSFENKLQVFRYLVDKYNSEFKDSNKGYFNELTELIQERNVFAHYPILFSLPAMHNFDENEVLTFVKLKNVSHQGATNLVNERRINAEGITALLVRYDTQMDHLKKLLNIDNSSLIQG